MGAKFYVGLFGLVGVFARYFIGWFVSENFHFTFPAGTFFINILGSFMIGIVYVLGVEKTVISEPLRMGLMVGLLGGFTTFSSFSLETMSLLERGNYGTALSYFILSPCLGVLGAFAGFTATRFLIASH